MGGPTFDCRANSHDAASPLPPHIQPPMAQVPRPIRDVVEAIEAGRVSGRGYPGIERGELTDGRPVEPLPAMGEQGQKPIAQQAGQRQWNAELFRGGQRQMDVLMSQRSGKAGRFEFPVCK